jgi:hypothetical protein
MQRHVTDVELAILATVDENVDQLEKGNEDR